MISTAASTFVANPSPPELTSFTRKLPTSELTNADSLTFLATFNEDVSQVTTDDFTVNGVSSTVVSVSQVTPSTYDVVISGGFLGAYNGVVGINVANNPYIINGSGVELPNTEPTVDETYTLDNQSPQVSVSGVPASVNTTPFTATYTFSENVSGFDLADVTAGLTNATATSFATTTANLVFTALISPNGGVGVTVGVNAGAGQDDAGNDNDAATDRIATLDAVVPTVEIIGLPVSHDGSTPFDVTVEFSEDVTGFVQGDVTVGNGTVTGFITVDGNTYTVQITPTNRNDVTLDIDAGVAQDAAGNLNTAATQVTVGGTVIEDTQKAIGSFMENRAAGISNAQPDFDDFVRSRSEGRFSVNGNENNLTLNYAASVTLNAAGQSIEGSFDALETDSRQGSVDLWTQVLGVNVNAGDAKSKLWVGYFGGHTFLSEDMLIGALVQVDFAEETNKVAGSSVDGTGWMIGPYIAGKVTGQDVFYEARIAWGMSENNISPFGTYTDTFDTERWVASGKLSGDYQWGDVTFSPNIALFYSRETQKAYVDSLTNTIPSQTITSGELSFGPSISKAMVLDDGAILTPKAGLSAIYTLDANSSNGAQVLAFKQGDLRAKLEFGLSLLALNGMMLSSDLFYDGFGIDDYEAWGGQIKWTVPLQ